MVRGPGVPGTRRRRRPPWNIPHPNCCFINTQVGAAVTEGEPPQGVDSCDVPPSFVLVTAGALSRRHLAESFVRPVADLRCGCVTLSYVARGNLRSPTSDRESRQRAGSVFAKRAVTVTRGGSFAARG